MPGEHDLSRRLADSDDGVGVLKAQPLRGERVDVRGEVFHRPAIHVAGVEVHVIRGEEHVFSRGAAWSAVSGSNRTARMVRMRWNARRGGMAVGFTGFPSWAGVAFD